MDLSLYFPCVYPLIKQTQQRFGRANFLIGRDVPLSSFALQNPNFRQILSRRDFNGERRRLAQEKASSSSVVRSKSNKSSDEQTSNPSKPNKEKIIALFKRIKASISKGKSHIDKEKNLVISSENEPMTKAILDVLEKSRKKPKGDTEKKTPKSNKEEKASLMETMKVAELKEIAKNKGIKGYSKLKKTELLDMLKSS